MWSISPPIRGPLPPFQHLARWEGGAQKPSLVSIQSCFLEGLRQVKEGGRQGATGCWRSLGVSQGAVPLAAYFRVSCGQDWGASCVGLLQSEVQRRGGPLLGLGAKRKAALGLWVALGVRVCLFCGPDPAQSLGSYPRLPPPLQSVRLTLGPLRKPRDPASLCPLS